MNENMIRAITPMFLGTIGLVIAVTAIATRPSTEVVYAAFNLSSVAIGAAGGSAVPTRNSDVRTNNVENIEIEK